MPDKALFDSDPRDYALALVSDGALGADRLAQALLVWMSCDDVREALDANELSPRFLDDEQDDDDDEQEPDAEGGAPVTIRHAWSKPFHGVQHLTGRDGFRCTVEEYRTFAQLTRWYPGCGFTKAMQSTHLDAAAARLVGEGWIDAVFSRVGLAEGGAP